MNKKQIRKLCLGFCEEVVSLNYKENVTFKLYSAKPKKGTNEAND